MCPFVSVGRPWLVGTVTPAGYTSRVTDAAKKLLDDALVLPPDDRARLASALIASLDESRDTPDDSEWIEELERRAEQVRAGHSEGSPWPEVRARLLARLTTG